MESKCGHGRSKDVYCDFCYNNSPNKQRADFAAMVMQGLLSNSKFSENLVRDTDMFVKTCALMADALIKELNKDPNDD